MLKMGTMEAEIECSRVSMFQLKHDAGIRIKGYELARSMLSKYYELALRGRPETVRGGGITTYTLV